MIYLLKNGKFKLVILLIFVKKGEFIMENKRIFKTIAVILGFLCVAVSGIALYLVKKSSDEDEMYF